MGNKGDLEGREVEAEEARKWAEEEGLAGYVETSAKDGTGVEEVRFVVLGGAGRADKRDRRSMR